MRKILTAALWAAIISIAACSGGAPAQEELHSMDTVAMGDIQFHIETIAVDSGYGYVIAINGKNLIEQDIIPALPGNRPFRTEAQAFSIGRLALRKMCSGAGLPSISLQELIDNGVADEEGNIR